MDRTFLSICRAFVVTLVVLFSVAGVHALPVSERMSQMPRMRFPDDAYFNKGMASMCVSTPRMVRWVFENHFKQLNRCSVRGLKMERTPATQLFFGPAVVRGEAEVDEVFSNFCRPRAKGGLKGLTFTEKEAFIVGNTISVLWVADAPFLKQPYPGSDSYVTCGNRMLTITSSFDSAELQYKD